MDLRDVYIYIYIIYDIILYTYLHIFFEKSILDSEVKEVRSMLGEGLKESKDESFLIYDTVGDCLSLVLWCLYDVSFNFCFQEQTYHIYDSSINLWFTSWKITCNSLGFTNWNNIFFPWGQSGKCSREPQERCALWRGWGQSRGGGWRVAKPHLHDEMPIILLLYWTSNWV